MLYGTIIIIIIWKSNNANEILYFLRYNSVKYAFFIVITGWIWWTSCSSRASIYLLGFNKRFTKKVSRGPSFPVQVIKKFIQPFCFWNFCVMSVSRFYNVTLSDKKYSFIVKSEILFHLSMKGVDFRKLCPQAKVKKSNYSTLT